MVEVLSWNTTPQQAQHSTTQYIALMTTQVEPLVIDDNGNEAVAKALNDNDKLARLEKNLQTVKEITDAGNTPDLETEAGDDSTVSGTQGKNKRRKIKEKKFGHETEVTYAPSFDEVTADNDHLANLRGEGRYFGVTDPDANEPTCSNCHRRGHRRAQCKVVVCHACGKVDDHYETQCPNSMVCSNCGEKGHFRNNCPQRRTQTYCIECDSRNHSSDRCPSIWRSYVLMKRTQGSKMAYPSSKIFCYNCAEKGHYGDDCPEMRVSKTPNINGSAFSGDNLPKELVGQYMNSLQRVKAQDRSANDSSYDSGHRKRNYDTANNTNYNNAPPPYPRFNRNNNGNNSNGYSTNYRSNNNNYGNGNGNSYRNNNYGNNSNQRIPAGPTKVGYIPSRPNSQNQRRNQGGYNNQNGDNRGNINSYNSRSTYFNNNNNRNFSRNNNSRY
jgi:protein AIR1/2